MKILNRRPTLALMVMLTAALAMMILPATAMAQQGPGHGEKGQGHFTSPRHLMRIADDLELRDEQREAIGDILEENRSEIRPLRQEMRQESTTLREMMDDDSVSRQQVFEQLDKVLALEAQVKQKRTAMLLDVRDILDQDQREKARELFEDRRERMGERRGERRQNRQQRRQQRRGE
jgi:Spy/CpxP family protein refolding chaperone